MVAQLVKNPPAVQEIPVRFLGWEIPPRRDRLPTPEFLGSSGAQTVRNPPRMRETWVQSLGWEDSLEEGVATLSSILAWIISTQGGAWRATAPGVAESDVTKHSTEHA